MSASVYLDASMIIDLDSNTQPMPDSAERDDIAETDYLLRSPNNARRLLESIAELEGGGGIERELVVARPFTLP
jgi:hypothetical protein